MMLDKDAYIKEVRKKISVLPKINKRFIESLLQQTASAKEDKTSKLVAKINSVVDPAYTRHIIQSKNPVLPFPSKDDSAGDGFVIGNVMAGDQKLYPFELSTENLRENIFVTARSGHGKTSLVYYFVDFLVRNKINFVFFDFKQDYRILARRYPDITVLRWSELRYNPLTNAPANMDVRIWHRILLDVYSHCNGLLMATPGHMLDAIGDTWNEKNGQMTFADLEAIIKNQRHETLKENEYTAVAKNRLSNTNHALGNVINCRHGFDVSELFSGQIVIEMHPLDFQMSSFLIQSLIMHEFHRRMQNQVRMNRKSTVSDEYFKDNFTLLIMDEGHNLNYSGQEDSIASTELSVPPLVTFFSQSRELLMGSMTLTQFPHLIMDAFKHNAGVKIIGNIVESDLQNDLGASVGMDTDDSANIGKLQKGKWIANVAGRTKKPFLLDTPYVEKGNIMAESEMLSRSERLVAKLIATQKDIEKKFFSTTPYSERQDNPHMPEISRDSWNVLNFIFDNEFAYQKQITDGVGISGDKMMSIKKTLLQKGLVRTVKFAVVDYLQVHYILTPKTLEIFGTMGKNQNRIRYWKFLSKTHPGYEHRLFQHVLKRLHKKDLGWNVTLEKTLADKRRVDIYCVHPHTQYRKAIEIETSTRDLENKLRILADGHADELVLLYKDHAGLTFAESKIETIAKQNRIKRDRIWIGLAKDYIKTIIGIVKHSETARNGPKQFGPVPEGTGNPKRFRNSLQPGEDDD